MSAALLPSCPFLISVTMALGSKRRCSGTPSVSWNSWSFGVRLQLHIDQLEVLHWRSCYHKSLSNRIERRRLTFGAPVVWSGADGSPDSCWIRNVLLWRLTYREIHAGAERLHNKSIIKVFDLILAPLGRGAGWWRARFQTDAQIAAAHRTIRWWETLINSAANDVLWAVKILKAQIRRCHVTHEGVYVVSSTQRHEKVNLPTRITKSSSTNKYNEAEVNYLKGHKPSIRDEPAVCSWGRTNSSEHQHVGPVVERSAYGL